MCVQSLSSNFTSWGLTDLLVAEITFLSCVVEAPNILDPTFLIMHQVASLHYAAIHCTLNSSVSLDLCLIELFTSMQC